MKLLFYLIMIVGFAHAGFAKDEMDTISNWQVYRDSQLLFKSHLLDSHRFTSRIKKSDQYQSLIVTFFCDARTSGMKKVDLVFDKKVILSMEEKADNFTIEIPKNAIDKSIKGYYNKDIFIKYYDNANPQGVVLGILIFESQ